MTSDGLLQLKDVRVEDAGKYRCVARNLLGNDVEVTTLIVQSELQNQSIELFPNHNILQPEYAKNIQIETFHDTNSV